MFISSLSGSGIVINLVDSEESMETCRAIEKHFGKTIYAINEEDLNDFEIIDIDSKWVQSVAVCRLWELILRRILVTDQLTRSLFRFSKKYFADKNRRLFCQQEHLKSWNCE